MAAPAAADAARPPHRPGAPVLHPCDPAAPAIRAAMRHSMLHLIEELVIMVPGRLGKIEIAAKSAHVRSFFYTAQCGIENLDGEHSSNLSTIQ